MWISNDRRSALGAGFLWWAILVARHLAHADPSQIIELGLGETKKIPVRALERALAVNSGVVQAMPTDDRNVAIQGVAAGETFVHVWDADGFRTYVARVAWQPKRAVRQAARP